jgi:hypothetical protein
MLSLCALVIALSQPEIAPAEKWPADAFFGLHYDLHPNTNDTELGRETTYEHIYAELDKVKPDYVQYDCKGHPGYAGYPTEVGSPAPGIVNDALAVWREVTRDMGVPLSVHFSGVWDTRAIELHPEWANINARGHAHKNYTDLLSDYERDLLIPQLVEVVTKYDLDGVWVDGENWATLPSWSDRVIAEWTKRTGKTKVPKKVDDEDWHAWLDFQRDLFEEHVRHYADALHAAKPDVAVCSNWMYSVRQPNSITAPIDYVSGDFDPSFGAARACAEARFISQRGMPWNLMAWSFLRTGGQQWTSKTAVHLSQEVAVTLAQGGSVFIYNQPQRSGRLTSWHQDIFGEVAEFCRARKPYCFKSDTVPQVAILHSQSFYYRNCQPLYNFADANHPMEGALHALLENGYSVDILNEDMFIERGANYRIVIVPEQEGLPQNVVDALKAFVHGGGNLVLSGHRAAFELGDLAGVVPVEGAVNGGTYVPADNGAVLVGGTWQQIDAADAELIAFTLNQQDPVLNRTDWPAATLRQVGNGSVVLIPGPVFRAYYKAHYPRLRRFIGDCVAALDATTMQVEGPSHIEFAARQMDGRLLLQFVNRGVAGYLAPDRHMVEHVADTGPFTVRIPMEIRPTRCYMAPDRTGLDWTWRDGVLTANVAGLHIHNVLVIEP